MKPATPETDAYIGNTSEDDMTEGEIAMCEFARKMERERNEARREAVAFRDGYCTAPCPLPWEK